MSSLWKFLYKRLQRIYSTNVVFGMYGGEPPQAAKCLQLEGKEALSVVKSN